MPHSRQTRRAKALVLLDLIRLQNAPVSPNDPPNKLLNDIKAKVQALQLPESDAQWFYRTMQLNGWKWKGTPVKDWQVLVDLIFERKYFPSQRV